ncbi:UNVERIFIED_CONTAM: hypothetical protein Sangu_0204000 [Sesamum angustifolium]|uniref:Uncharacterized protein n=1 Tax=Sesamum angustifolium TaxID=2727405 RepID=A0AAW2RMQ9_9LAMI
MSQARSRRWASGAGSRHYLDSSWTSSSLSRSGWRGELDLELECNCLEVELGRGTASSSQLCVERWARGRASSWR